MSSVTQNCHIENEDTQTDTPFCNYQMEVFDVRPQQFQERMTADRTCRQERVWKSCFD